MADNIVRLKLDSREYDANIKSAAAGLTRMEKECRRVAGTLEVVEKEQLAYVKAIGQMETKSDSARGKMRELNAAIKDAKMVYNDLTDAEKESPFGQALSQSIDQLKGRLSPLIDMTNDLDQEFKHLASDTSFADGMNSLTSTIGSCASAMVAWTGDSKEMESMIKELAKVQTAVAAIKAVTNAFQEQNLVLLKNPYVIAAGAIYGLVTALGALDEAINGLSQEEKTHVELQKKAIENYAKEKAEIDTLHSIANDYTRSYEDREAALKRLNEITPDYHGALSQEGTLINDNIGALNNYISKLQQTATAQAAFEKIVELTKEKLDLQSSMGTGGGPLDVMQSDAIKKAQIDAIDKQVSRLYGMTNTSGVTGTSINIGGGAASLASAGGLAGTVAKVLNRDNTAPTSRGGSSYSVGLNLPDINPLTPGTTSAMGDLQSQLKYWQNQRGQTGNAFIEAGVEQNISDTQAKIDAQPIALSLGLSEDSVVDVQDTMTSLMDTMREEMKENPLEVTATLTNVDKSIKSTTDNVKGAANAFSALGGAISKIDDPTAKVAGLIASAIGNTAAAFGAAQMQAKDQGPWAWIAFAATGLATMITTIAGIKDATAEYHADGGIVGNGPFVPKGTDTVPAMLTPGETVLTAAQTANIASLLTEDDEGEGGQVIVRSEQLIMMLNNYGMKHGLGKLKFG